MRRIRWLVVVLLCWGGAYVLASRILTSTESDHGAGSMVGQILSSSRAGVSETFVLSADRFFHLGSMGEPPRAFTNFLMRWSDEIRPMEHRHLDEVTVKEIMPWLRIATRVDPHNIDAYLIASYWMERSGHYELAHEILMEGHRKNLGSYRIYEARARFALREGDFKKSAMLLDAGLEHWELVPTNEDTRIDGGSMLAVRAALYELDNQIKDAIYTYEFVLKLFPDSKVARRRIEELERGERLLTYDSETIQTMVKRNPRYGGHGHDHGGHDHDHGGHDHDQGGHDHDQGGHDHDHGGHDHDHGGHDH